MRLVAVMPVRDEEWCVGLALRAAMLYCDAAVVLDHGSTDRTPAILAEVAVEVAPKVVKVIRDDGPSWDEMDHRQRMLVEARALGATHINLVDADEVLTGNLIPFARRFAELADRPGRVVAFPMVSTYHSTNTRRVDGNWGRGSRLTWVFADAPGLTWKPAKDGYQHHQRLPHGCDPKAHLAVTAMSGGSVFHLQFVSERRLREKAVYYKLMEATRWPGRMSARALNDQYDWTLRPGRPDVQPVPETWWEPYRQQGWLDKHLDTACESWQARAARALYAESPSRFAGIELHGVIEPAGVAP